MIVDPSGIILTNNHVVDGGGDITVRLSDGREFKAAEIKTDPKTDWRLFTFTRAARCPRAAGP